MTPSWYDVLGVEPDADPETIRASFRAEIADLDPTDRRFRAASKAAEVLLDPERRARHDADLAQADLEVEEEHADEHEPEDHDDLPPPPVTRPVTLDEPAADLETVPARDGARFGLTSTIVAGVVALVLLAVTVLSFVLADDSSEEPLAENSAPADTASSSGDSTSSDLPDARDIAAARAAAETAIVPVLSYDYRHLSDDKATALSYLTPAFADEYGKIFDGLIDENSPTTKTVVRAKLLASGISRTGVDRVDVVVFVDQVTTNKAVRADAPIVYKNQAIAQMVDTGGTWLLDCLVTAPGGGCDH